MSDAQFEAVVEYVQSAQKKLGDVVHLVETAAFEARHWQKDGLGAGCAMVISNGQVFERAVVSFSQVAGSSLPASALSADHRAEPYQCTGLSMIFHPQNPHCPSFHLNVRCFRLGDGGRWWFGGGADLTPYYPVPGDCRYFHRICKSILDSFDESYYPTFKSACDDYFHIPHRNEARGIGGVFFDHFNAVDFAYSFELVKSMLMIVAAGYIPIIMERHSATFTAQQRDFQCMRRGRYAEFNLMYDRGTRFGLHSGALSDLILLSLPPVVHWGDFPVEPGSDEARAIELLSKPRDWLALTEDADSR